LQSSKLKRTVGDAADQALAPIWKIYPAPSHAEQYITNFRYCGNLLWQSGLFGIILLAAEQGGNIRG
jgi:hypothetical protein